MLTRSQDQFSVEITKGSHLKKIIFSMLCNMRSKLIPTNHIYIHKYRSFLSVDTFLNLHMYLKSLLIAWVTQ